MTFILGDQLDKDINPNLALQVYASYLENNRRHFPDSVFDVINHENWESGGSDSNSPYYSELKNIELKSFGQPDAELILTLEKSMYVEKPFHIEIIYSGLFHLDIPNQDWLSENPLIWRYNQFLYFNPYTKYNIKEQKMFTHQIEWVGQTVWSITAREIAAKWIF